jgi:hypothetical protein
VTHEEVFDLFYDRFHCHLVAGLTLLVGLSPNGNPTMIASDDDGRSFMVAIDDHRLEREPGQFFVPTSVREAEGDGLLRCFEEQGMARFTGRSVTANGQSAEVWTL